MRVDHSPGRIDVKFGEPIDCTAYYLYPKTPLFGGYSILLVFIISILLFEQFYSIIFIGRKTILLGKQGICLDTFLRCREQLGSMISYPYMWEQA